MKIAASRSLVLTSCLFLSGIGLISPDRTIAQERSESRQQGQSLQDRRAQLRERFQRQQRQRLEQDRKNSRNSADVISAFTKLVTPASKSVASIIVDGKAVALGCIVSKDGEVLTKASLLPETEFECKLPGGRTVKAKKVAVDKPFDLALVKVEAMDLKPMYFAEIEPSVGTLVTNASTEGKALGMGMVVAKPTEIAAARRARAVPNASAGFLGVATTPGEGGLRVGQVIARSAAQRSGIKVGDVILELNSEKISDPNGLRGGLSGKKAGDEITLLLKSNEDEPRELKVKLGRRTTGQQRATQDRWGGGPFSEVRTGFPMVIRHDSVIRPEDCGGPLVTSSGDVVGINIARALRVSCYAIPTASVTKVLAQLRESTGVDASKAKASEEADSLKVPPHN